MALKRVTWLGQARKRTRWWHRLFRLTPGLKPVWGSMYLEIKDGTVPADCDYSIKLVGAAIQRATGSMMVTFGGVTVEDANAPRPYIKTSGR